MPVLKVRASAMLKMYLRWSAWSCGCVAAGRDRTSLARRGRLGFAAVCV